MAFLDDAKKTKDSIINERDKAVKDLKIFKKRVLEETIAAAEENNLCDDGVAKYLDKLGIEYVKEFEVTMNFCIDNVKIKGTVGQYGEEFEDADLIDAINDAVRDVLDKHNVGGEVYHSDTTSY